MKIYIVGICGTGVGALAGLLKQQGHEVWGSDENVYPPMSDKLAEWQIPVLSGFEESHVPAQVDLVVIGNVVRATNPEAKAVLAKGFKVMSMPQAVAEFGIGQKHSIVVAGTHGKTTTTALIAHVLMHANKDPSYLVGGVLLGYADSFRVGSGAHFVIEGDEYDTAFFDKGPKFLHYRPRTAIITSLEYDHADIYPSIEAVEASFRKLIEIVPKDGRLVIWQGAERAVRLAKLHSPTRDILVYSDTPDANANLHLARYSSGPKGLVFEPVIHGRSLGEMHVPLWGQFSAQNVLAAVGALEAAGLNAQQIAAGMASFAGVKRRLEVRAEVGGVTVVDDFGHHPTAVQVTLEAAKTRWPGRRLWALFEPRSATSRRNVFQQEFVDAFAGAQRVTIASHERLGEIPEADRFSPDKLARDLVARGVDAKTIAQASDIAQDVVARAQAGDVVMVFSNGAFGGIHKLLIDGLRARS